ncbi:MAG: Tad domain-containing protein [Lentisphaeria bacterium]|nr:Tad domain-containing protein [Lentisphaeria bacterium]
MKRNPTALRRRRGEHGQVLILAVVALILVIIAVLLLFDVQTVIRGKVKAQNGVDAAALTGAEWQKHSLNLIGELNLVRATGTLISDPFLAKGIMNNPNSNAAEFFADLPRPLTQEEFTLFPEKAEFYNEDGSLNTEKLVEEVLRVEKEKRYLDALDDLVSQLQTRISFVGPLIGFGAAQQAAKNNGLTFDSDASNFYIQYLNLVENDGIYERITPVFVKDYGWRPPYVSMLNSILDYSAFHNDFTGDTENRAYGIAAGTKFKFVGMPSLTANPPSDLTNYLGDKHFYDMIHARDWCGLDRLLRLDFSGNWWGDFECEFDEDFSGQSEILPLHIDFSESTGVYDDASEAKALARYAKGRNSLFGETFNRENPYEYEVSDDVEQSEEHDGNKHTYYTFTNITISINAALFEQTYNDEDADRRYDLLPRLAWAVYDEDWGSYGDETREWEEYLRGRFKPGMDYQSGALAYFEAHQDTVTVSGSMGRPRGGRRAADVGQVFASAQTNGEAQRVSSALYRLNNTNSVNKIETNAEAKPIGRLKTDDGKFLRPFEAGRMVLPVFTETALIPIALEPVDGMSMSDIDWLYYLTEFVPLLSGSPSLQDAWQRASELYPTHLGYFSKYVSALAVLSDPEFRRAGLDWLDATAVWAKDENGNRYPLYTNREYYCTGRHGGNGPGGGWQGTNFSNGGPSKLH